MTSRPLRPIAATLALFAILAVLFAPALFNGRILAPLDITTRMLPPWGDSSQGPKAHNHNPSDAVTQYLPYRLFAEKSLREDGYIGWNPYEMGGYSLAANTMALPASWPMQLHRWFPFKDAWNLGIAGEFLIAGLGMLVFLRSRKLPWLPCLIGASAFMLNAQFIVWVYHRWALGAFCWMPWVLWSYGSGFSIRPLPRRIFLLPFFLAMAFLGGTLQHMVFVVFACGCLAAAGMRFRRPLENIPSLAYWVLAGLLAVGMAAFSIVPQVSGYLSNIAIGHTRGGIGYEAGPIQPLIHSLLIPARIWPWLIGDPQTIDGWKALKSDFMSLNYIGTIPMILGFAGLFVRSMPTAAKWLIAVGLLIPLTPLVGPLYHRVELLFILGAAWMTAEMLARLPEIRSAFPWRRCLVASVAAIGLLLTIATLLPNQTRNKIETKVVAAAVAKGSSSQFGADRAWLESRAREWFQRISITHPRTAWVYGLLALGSAGLVFSSKITNRQSILIGHLLILGATVLELGTLFQTWTTFSHPADLHPPHHTLDRTKTLAGGHRVLHTSGDKGLTQSFAAPNLLASYFIPSINAYESIQYRSPLIALADHDPALKLELAGVGLAIHRSADPAPPGSEAWNAETLVDGFTARTASRVPPSIAAGRGRLPTDPQQISSALLAAKALQPEVETMNRLSLEVPQGSDWLRIARNWHPGWKWRVPGGDWQSFRDGADASCWIPDLPKNTRNIEACFFPRPTSLTLVSILTAAFAAFALPATCLQRRINSAVN